MRATAKGFTCILVLITTVSVTAPAPVCAQQPYLNDLVYNSFHPRLLFGADEIPDLYARVRDGGHDDEAYNYVKSQFDSAYQTLTMLEFLDEDFAMEQLPNVGLVKFLESPYDTAAQTLGKAATIYIAQNYDVDWDPYYSSLRLKSLSLGYDLFFDDATPQEREIVRDEVVTYLVKMARHNNFLLWGMSPYVSNKTAMLGASVGLAAVCFHSEIEPVLVDDALAAADQYITNWMNAHLEREGAYREGALYGTWCFRNLVYYFEARRRFDGYDYSTWKPVRNFEKWLAYELDPSRGGAVNNLNDCTDFHSPLARHTTYADWAQARWGSQLSAYIWEYTAGAYGLDLQDNADKVGTVLWNQSLPPINPASVLPVSRVWEKRGLYYYRSGWPAGSGSDDVVFSFYSGKFMGGHAQEDQNQFTLTAYGNKMVTDHGAGNKARQSEAHNLVFIDGAGEHNAGGSIGTDGKIAEYVLGNFADYVLGDATLAYSTHSEYNEPDTPFVGADWSWGYVGENPVLHALRKVVVVHSASTDPYFLILDDIDKDGGIHSYDWCLHTPDTNVVDVTPDSVQIVGPGAGMEVCSIGPNPVVTSVTPFDNQSPEADSKLIALSTNAVNPLFTVLLFPHSAAVQPQALLTTPTPTGSVTSMIWNSSATDLLVINYGGGAPDTIEVVVPLEPDSQATSAMVTTDAEIALLRVNGATVTEYLVDGATTLKYGSTEYVKILDGPAAVTMGGQSISVSRADADFVLHANGATEVLYRDEVVPTVDAGGYLTPKVVSAAPTVEISRASALRVYPNPSNPDVTVTLTLAVAGTVEINVFDVTGARVATILSGWESPGKKTVHWQGKDDRGRRMPSGIYFVRASGAGWTQTAKVALVE